jgi:hypothetical protein
MLHWGPAFVDVSVRRLGATQLAAVGLRNPVRARCVVSFAFESRADPRTGCSGRVPVPEKPGWCLDRTGTFACAINRFGAYNCPLIHEPLGPPLTKKNATTDKRGVLKLDASLKSTRSTPPLAWHRYPHRDGFIEPWTRAGKLRPGMKLTGKHRGTCSPGSEETHATSELRCLTGNGVGRFYLRFDPCFPPPGDWNRRGVVVACASPGATTFSRFAITERS